jgi:hypothetical protein
MADINTQLDLTYGIGATVSRSGSPSGGVTDASQPYLIENIVEGLAMEIMRRESFLNRICNTQAMKKLTEFGQMITFRVLNPPAVKAYTVNQKLVVDTVTGTNFSLTVDNSWYSYPVIDPIDLKQINVDLLGNLARMMADAHAENEYSIVVAAMITAIFGATQMAYHGQTPGTVAYGGATPINPVSTDRTDSDYIIKYFLSAQKRYNQMAVPKKGRYALVNSDVNEILLLSDQFTYNIGGEGNKKLIEEGEGSIRVAGFDIYVTDEIPTTTYGGVANIAQVILGHQNGAAFVRQLLETEIGFKLQDQMGRAMRTLDVFGFGLSDSRLMGYLPLKVA